MRLSPFSLTLLTTTSLLLCACGGGNRLDIDANDFAHAVLDNRVILHEKSGSRALYQGRATRDADQQEAAIASFRKARSSGYAAIRTEATRELAQLLYAERKAYDAEIMELLQEAAKSGDAPAITMLAQAYSAEGKTQESLALLEPIITSYLPARRLWLQQREAQGEDVSQDLPTLVQDYESLASAGDSSAYLPLAALYNRADMPFFNQEKAIAYYELAATQQDQNAYLPLARLYRATDKKEAAISYYKKAAALGNLSAMRALMKGYAPQGWYQEKEGAYAHWAQTLANTGDIKAMWHYGLLLAAHDKPIAARTWLDNAIAQDAGLAYKSGKALLALQPSTPEKRVLARHYLLQAAEAKDVRAFRALRNHFMQRITTLSQAEQAATLANAEPSLVNERLCRELASIFLKNGRSAQGITWLKEAAKRGSRSSLNALANYYRTGQHVEQNATTAFTYTLQAAKLGDKEAAHQAGLAYARGIGVAKDTVQARHWLGISTDGDMNAADALLKGLGGE